MTALERYTEELTNPHLLSCLRGFAYSISPLREDADDLYGETLLHAWRGLTKGQFQNRGNCGIKPWLFGIMRHLNSRKTLYDHQQCRDTRITVRLECVPEEKEPRTPPLTDRADLLISAFQGVSDMNPVFAKTMELYAQGYDRHEMADQLGIKPETIKGRMHRIRAHVAPRVA